MGWMKMKKEKNDNIIETVELDDQTLLVQPVDEYLKELEIKKQTYLKSLEKKKKEEKKRLDDELKKSSEKIKINDNFEDVSTEDINNSLFKRIAKELLYKKNISSTEFKRVAEAQIIKTYKYKGYFKFLSFNRFMEWYKNKYLRGRIFFIIMQLRNGKYDMFTIRSVLPYFEHRGGMYIVDPDMTREDLHSRHNVIFYHQDFAAPFKITFDVTKIHNTVTDSDEDKTVDKALNPSSLKGFINSQVIEKVLKGQELTDQLKLLLILVIISLIINVIVGFIVAKSSGLI
jgi:hypothetical protein